MWIVDKQRLARLPALLLLSLGAMSCRKAGNPVKPKQDTTAPVITAGPTILSLTDSSATVTWQTDDLSTSVVQYSKDGSFASAAGDSTMVTYHSVPLGRLAASTTYNYRVVSRNAVNLTMRSAGKTFTTHAGGVIPSRPTAASFHVGPGRQD